MGMTLVSTGHGVTEWTARQCERRKGWDYPAEEAKSINANDEVFALAA